MQLSKVLRTTALVGTIFIAPGCVTSGYEGQVGAMVAGDQVIARREANRSVEVYQTAPTGLRSLGETSARRCHRSFVEEEPSEAAIIDDLKLAAFAQGGDAISDIRTERKNGLLANCWYVVEATASVWRR